MPTKRTLTRQLADARQTILDLADKRDEALGDAGSERFNVSRLAKQLTEAREENDELRHQLNARRPADGPSAWKRERARLRQLLDLSERARAALDAQLVQLGRANDRLNREAYDRAIPARPAEPHTHGQSGPYGISTGDTALNGRQTDQQPNQHTRTIRIGGEDQ